MQPSCTELHNSQFLVIYFFEKIVFKKKMFETSEKSREKFFSF